MKYSYIDKPKSEIIENYSVNSDQGKIIINFLDGSTYDMPLSDENEEIVLDKMLKQAQERRQSIQYGEVEKRTQTDIFATLLSTAVACVNGIAASIDGVNIPINSNQPIEKLNIIIAGIFGVSAIICYANFKKNFEEQKDLEKYMNYLDIKEELEENIENSNLFNGIDSSKIPPNKEKISINEVDDYSLEDLKQIKLNLQRINEFTPETRGKELIKK